MSEMDTDTGTENQEGTETPEVTPQEDALMTQAEVDRIVKQRLARQREQFQGYAEFKEKAEAFDALEAEKMSELERANARIADLESQATAALEQAKEQRLRAAIVSEASKNNVVDPDAAVLLINRGSLDFDEQGNATNIAEAMEILLTEKPYLAGQATRVSGSADQGARGGVGGQLTREQLSELSPEEIVAAQSEGRLDALRGLTTTNN